MKQIQVYDGDGVKPTKRFVPKKMVRVDIAIGSENHTVTMEPATYELLLDRFKRRMSEGTKAREYKLAVEFFMPDGTEMQGFGCWISGVYEAKSLERATVQVDRMVGRMRHI